MGWTDVHRWSLFSLSVARLVGRCEEWPDGRNYSPGNGGWSGGEGQPPGSSEIVVRLTPEGEGGFWEDAILNSQHVKKLISSIQVRTLSHVSNMCQSQAVGHRTTIRPECTGYPSEGYHCSVI